MGFSIGGLLNDVGIKLPSIDLGSIGKTVLDEGKKLLGDVVKDSFTLSSQPGQVFDDSMNLNILGDNVRLPNPIGSLANKLLGKADGELNKFGVNVDFKSLLSNLFHLPTADGSVAVPPVAQRGGSIATPAATPAAATPASTSAASAAGVGGGGGAPAAKGSPTVGAAYDMSGSSADSGIITAMTGESDKLNGLINSINDNMTPAQLAKVQLQIQQAQEMMNTLSTILKDEHDTRMAIIGNMRS